MPITKITYTIHLGRTSVGRKQQWDLESFWL